MRAVKMCLILALAAGVIFVYTSILYADETSDLILKLLIKKGLVSQREVNELKAEIKKAKEVVKKPKDFNVYWKEGLRLDTTDKKFKLKIGGRTYTDAAWMTSSSDLKSSTGKLKDDAEFRTARLYASGTIYDDFIYKAQFDFAGGDADFKDVYLGMIHIPYAGTIKAGHFKEPFSLEELTSSRFITFMERAAPNAFAPGRNVGIAANNTLFDQKATWAAGIFRDADSFGNATTNEWNLTGRVTALPWYKDKGEQVAHFGIAYSLRCPEDTLDYDQEPGVHLAPDFADTGAFNARLANLLGFESAIVYGPFSLQSEYIQSIITMNDSDIRYLGGVYAQASYFLTGEHRNYKRSAGAFSRVKPFKNFSIEDRTFGAWELAGRFSYLDLKDDDISGEIMKDVTLGLNWYLNPNMRIMWNYIHSHVNGQGDADIIQTRFQVDF